jgi:hypothetical protein
MIKKYTPHVHTTLQTEGGGNGYTLHVHRRLLLVLLVLYDVEKSYVNAGMLEKSLSGIGIFTDSQLLQFGIGVPASGSVWYRR